MDRFDRLVEITDEILADDLKPLGGLRINREENYIGVERDGCGEINTEIIYEPEKGSIRILTFNNPPILEEQLGKVCRQGGIDFILEVRERPYLPSGGIFNGLFPRSPSGRSDEEFMDYLIRKSKK